MTINARRILHALASIVLGGALFSVGTAMLREPLGIALWSVVIAIVLLPLALGSDVPFSEAVAGEVALATPRKRTDLHRWSYAFAILPVVVATLLTIGLSPAIVLAVVAFSLVGSVELLAALRFPVSVAIAMTILAATLSFTWPIWSAGLLTTHDIGPWLQRLINISPAFALNIAIAADDPLTHRPLAYRLMNLGQDVNYAMPMNIWPCVLLHAGVGVLGMLSGMIWPQMNPSTYSGQAADERT